MDYKTTINNIFSPRKNLFAVPNYQRAYSWDKSKQVAQFLNDLKEHPKSVEQYHLGHFLFETDTSNKNKFWIIDGQQRLTTVVIFFSCVYKKLCKIGGYESIAKNLYQEYLRSTDGEQKYTTVSYDNNFFENIVIEGSSDTIDTRSRRRIKEAYDYFSKEFDKDNVTVEDILSWKDLLEGAKITTDTVVDKSEATQLFTFQNDRGKDLTELEKLKSFLMFNVYLSSSISGTDPNNDIIYIEREFESIYQLLEKITIADEDQVLNYHTIAYLSTEDASLDRVKKAFSKTAENQSKWIKDFSLALKRSFATVADVQNLRNKESLIADILYLDQYNSFPLLLKLFNFHKRDQLTKILRLLEILLFRKQYTVGNYRTNKLHTVAQHYDGNIDNLEKLLLHYSKTGFKGYWNFTGDFLKRLEGDYHYLPLTKYLLWKYENKLRSDEREPVMNFAEFANLYGKFNLQNTIDHWTPQKPEELEYDQVFKDKYLNNIGNLVLATRGRNSSDNNDMPYERETHSVLIQRQKLEPFKNNWGKAEIENRQKEIVAFAKNYWDPEKLR